MQGMEKKHEIEGITDFPCVQIPSDEIEQGDPSWSSLPPKGSCQRFTQGEEDLIVLGTLVRYFGSQQAKIQEKTISRPKGLCFSSSLFSCRHQFPSRLKGL